MKKSIITASILSIGLVFSNSVNAATATSTLNVSATVIPACTVSTTPVIFGNLTSGPNVWVNGGVSVNCATGVPYHIALDAGSNYSPNSHVRQMMSNVAGNFAAYWLDLDTQRNQWGDSDYANTFPWGASVADTGNGLIQSHNVYATTQGLDQFAQPVPPGAYSDTVNVTVLY
jgi:spore coat protein U-like protein